MHLNSLRRSFGNFVQCIFKISMRVVDRFKINDLIVLVLGRIQKLRTLIFTSFWRSNFELLFLLAKLQKYLSQTPLKQTSLFKVCFYNVCLNYV